MDKIIKNKIVNMEVKSRYKIVSNRIIDNALTFISHIIFNIILSKKKIFSEIFS